MEQLTPETSNAVLLSTNFCAKTKETPVYQLLRTHLTIFHFALYKCTHHYYYYDYYADFGDAPRYLGPFTSTADVPGRRALRSARTKRLVVPSVRLSTVGSRAFPVAAAQIWNSLPEHIVSAPTLQSFRRHLNPFLPQQSFCL